jgi:hypothetical protein
MPNQTTRKKKSKSFKYNLCSNFSDTSLSTTYVPDLPMNTLLFQLFFSHRVKQKKIDKKLPTSYSKIK